MVSLASVSNRFEISLTVIAGGSGVLRGIVSETDQSQVPSYIFVSPRHVLRTRHPTAARIGMVVQTPNGEVYILGDNGPSEQAGGTIWDSFRMFRATGKLPWRRRGTVIDPITRQKAEGAMQDLGNIWVAIEPTDREELERRMSASHERARFLAAEDVRADDLIGEYEVIRSDPQLGLRIGFLTY